jgi:hypothetical protein
MKKTLTTITTILFLLLGGNSYAQTTITGHVVDTAGNGLPNVSVLLKKKGSTAIVAFALSKPNGAFAITVAATDSGLFVLEASSIGYLKAIMNHTGNPAKMVLKADVKTFKEVVIKSMAPPIIINNDTTEYRASAYKTPETRKVQDLLRNMPGFTVDADGKIKHDGKEVNRILIDGDDLAARNYTLISKNLTANVVDKVQVIDNYNENEVLKTVSKSGQVAINLKTTKAAKIKVSGSATVASSFFKRNLVDANALLLRKLKMMALGNYNSIGNAVEENTRYKFSGDINDITDGAAATGLLATGGVGAPPLAAAYTYNNSDLNTALMTGWRGKKGRKYRALASYVNTANRNTGNGYLATIIDANQRWQQNSADYFRQTGQNLLANFTTQKATGTSKHVQTDMDIALGSQAPRYGSTVGGAITDTLAEQLQRSSFSTSFKHSITAATRQNRVFSLVAAWRYTQGQEDLQAITNRWQDYFQLSPFYNINRQGIQYRQHAAWLQASWLGKKGSRLQYSTGAALYADALATKATTSFAATLKADSLLRLNTVQQNSQIIKALAFAKMQQKINQRQTLGISLQTGLAHARLQPLLTSNSKLLWVANGSIAWQYQKTATGLDGHGVGVRYSFGRNLPDVNQYFAPALITGGAALLLPAQSIIPETKHSLAFSYGFGSILTGKVSIMVTGSVARNSFVKSYRFSPNLTEVLLLPTPQNNQLMASFTADRYVRPLKIMATLTIGHTTQLFDNITNGALYHNTRYYTSISGKVSTAFKGRINAEGQYTLANSRFATRTAGFSNSSSLFTHNGYAKLKISPTKRIYTALLVNNYVFSPGNQFVALDAYITYRLKSKYDISLTGHNLTNRQLLVQKSITGFSESISNFVLVPRYLLLKFSFDF